MKHSEAHKLLDDYLDNELTRDLVAQVDAHLMQCADCREALEYLRGLTRLAGELPSDQRPRRDLWAGIENAIAAPAAESCSRKSRFTAAGAEGSADYADYTDYTDNTGHTDYTGATGKRRPPTFSWKPILATVAVAASLALIIAVGGQFGGPQTNPPLSTGPAVAHQTNWGARGGIVAPADMSTIQAIAAEFAQTAAAFAAICAAPDSSDCRAVDEFFGTELDLIEQAIAEARGALTDNPYSPQAMSSLIAALKHREAIQLKALQLIENVYRTT